MPKPVFADSDYANPEADPEDRVLRPDHPRVRDASYDDSAYHMRQQVDLLKDALFKVAIDPCFAEWDESAPPERWERLELYVKERPRGRGYLSDFLYWANDIPVMLYGTFANVGAGLVISEIQLWRTDSWEYRDSWGDYVGPDGDHGLTDEDEDEWAGEVPARAKFVGITPELIRRLPIGRICQAAQIALAERDWGTEGVRVVGGPFINPSDLSAEARIALANVSTLATPRSRGGRPRISDASLIEFATTYRDESLEGSGRIRRLASRFHVSEATIKGWTAMARSRGHLEPRESVRNTDSTATHEK